MVEALQLTSARASCPSGDLPPRHSQAPAGVTMHLRKGEGDGERVDRNIRLSNGPQAVSELWLNAASVDRAYLWD